MKRTPVESSMIAAAGFDPATRTLEVEFASGEVYRYEGVPQEVYNGLLAAESKGQYMHANILGAYAERRVTRRRRR